MIDFYACVHFAHLNRRKDISVRCTCVMTLRVRDNECQKPRQIHKNCTQIYICMHERVDIYKQTSRTRLFTEKFNTLMFCLFFCCHVVVLAQLQIYKIVISFYLFTFLQFIQPLKSYVFVCRSASSVLLLAVVCKY